jgi:DNA-binding XRE family transcriptional regulator
MNASMKFTKNSDDMDPSINLLFAYCATLSWNDTIFYKSRCYKTSSGDDARRVPIDEVFSHSDQIGH